MPKKELQNIEFKKNLNAEIAKRREKIENLEYAKRMKDIIDKNKDKVGSILFRKAAIESHNRSNYLTEYNKTLKALQQLIVPLKHLQNK